MGITINNHEKHIHKENPCMVLIFSFAGSKIQIETMITQTVLQKSTITFATANRKGEPTPVQEGTLTAKSGDPNIFNVTGVRTADSINFEVDIESVGVGVSQLNIEADADLGEGVVNISGFTGVEVTPEMATGFSGFSQTNVTDK